MFEVDLHTHSRFFHLPPDTVSGFDPVGVRLSLQFAIRRGLDGLAVTNHDFFREETLVGPNCIPGIEISTTRGHLLVVGPNPPVRTQPGKLEPSAAVDLAHENDCAAIIAHPFRNSSLLDSGTTFDAIEINGKHPEYRRRVSAIAEERGLPIVGGSDAHFPFEVGRVSTRLDVERLTPTAVVTAIRDGRVEPTIREGRLEKTMGTIYTGIHRMKGHLRGPSSQFDE